MSEFDSVQPWAACARVVDALRPVLEQRIEQANRLQAGLLDLAASWADSCLARRRAGLADGRAAWLALGEAADPLAAGRIAAQWMAGSCERLMADGLEAQARLADIAHSLMAAAAAAAALPAAALESAAGPAEPGTAGSGPAASGRRAA